MAFVTSKSVSGVDEIVFNDTPNARQRYKLNGVPVVGVTTAIKGGYPTSEALVQWKSGKAAEYVWDNYDRDDVKDQLTKNTLVKRAKMAWKTEAEEAAGIGVAVHEYAELCSKGKKEEGLEVLAKYQNSDQWNQLVNALYKVDDFMKQNNDEIIATEQIVGSTKHQYAGRFDRLVRRGKLVIMSDYKTSKSFYIDQFIQDALYSVAVEEWLGVKVDGFEVIRFGKDGGDFESRLITDPQEIEGLKQQALRCLETFKFAKTWGADERFAYKKLQDKGSLSKSETVI